MPNIKEYAFNLLSRRDYGMKELERKLALKGFEESEIESLIAYLLELNFLDDSSLIERTIISQIKSGKNKRQINSYLLNRGFSNNQVQELLNLHCTKETEEASLLQNYRKITRSSKPVSEEKIINRLRNKGFSYSDIKKHLDEES